MAQGSGLRAQGSGLRARIRRQKIKDKSEGVEEIYSICGPCDVIHLALDPFCAAEVPETGV
jgi:hypothetical protein